MEAVGKIFRQRDGISRFLAVPAQSLGNDQPVDICTNRQTDRSPRGVSDPAPVRNARQAHEQPPGHIRRLRAHRRHPGAQAPAPEEISV